MPRFLKLNQLQSEIIIKHASADAKEQGTRFGQCLWNGLPLSMSSQCTGVPGLDFFYEIDDWRALDMFVTNFCDYNQ